MRVPLMAMSSSPSPVRCARSIFIDWFASLTISARCARSICIYWFTSLTISARCACSICIYWFALLTISTCCTRSISIYWFAALTISAHSTFIYWFTVLTLSLLIGLPHLLIIIIILIYCTHSFSTPSSLQSTLILTISSIRIYGVFLT